MKICSERSLAFVVYRRLRDCQDLRESKRGLMDCLR